jgi:hypothetical protein
VQNAPGLWATLLTNAVLAGSIEAKSKLFELAPVVDAVPPPSTHVDASAGQVASLAIAAET